MFISFYFGILSCIYSEFNFAFYLFLSGILSDVYSDILGGMLSDAEFASGAPHSQLASSPIGSRVQQADKVLARSC